MSDLYLRIDAKRNVVLYRTRTNQGVFMTLAELNVLRRALDYVTVPKAVEIGTGTVGIATGEFHRRVIMRGKRLVIEPGLHEPDFFDVRRLEDC